MKNKTKKPRDCFTEKGLDERQRQYITALGLKTLRVLFYGIAALTIVWGLLAISEIELPMLYTAMSFFIWSCGCGLVYEVQAARHGAMAFTVGGKGNAAAIIVCLPIIIAAIIISENMSFKIAMTVLVIVDIPFLIIEALCPRINKKAIEKQSEEDNS